MGVFKERRVSGPDVLRELLSSRDVVVCPGAYDALSARLVEAFGFECVYMTGFGTAASMFGFPDVGLVTFSEMVDNVRRIVRAVNVPVIADADTGYGNPINVVRTVQEYEDAGAAGLHIEDQVFPKKCGHLTGKELIPLEEMVEKIRAARDAKRNPNFLIIARTDAIAVEGVDMALERAREYYKAGADMIFVEAPESLEQIERIAKELRGIPLLFNWVGKGSKTPPVDLKTLKELGYKLVIVPVALLFAAFKAMREVLEVMKVDGVPIRALDRMVDFNEFIEFIGVPEIQRLEQKYVTKVRVK